jgi:phytoene dehydrogenase-like protein
MNAPWAPSDVQGGWDSQTEGFASEMVDQLEQHAPGFTTSIRREPCAPPRRWP